MPIVRGRGRSGTLVHLAEQHVEGTPGARYIMRGDTFGRMATDEDQALLAALIDGVPFGGTHPCMRPGATTFRPPPSPILTVW